MQKIKFISKTILCISMLTLWGCNYSQSDTESEEDDTHERFMAKYSQQDFDYLAISNPETMSLASKRALERNYHKYAEWFGVFSKHQLTGDLDYEKGVIRRDPSAILLIDGEYFTWYTKSVGKAVGFGSGDPDAKVFPWDKSEIWYATSKDGWHWEEQGISVGLGETGRYDDRSVFTPEVIAYQGKYYLVYQAIKAPYLNRTNNTVAMAIADDPRGPWKTLPEPILKAANNGQWLGEEDNRFLVESQGDFDSHKVHDPTLLFYRDKFYLYYKGERKGEKHTSGGREIRWGVAIADKPEGPYVKSPYNPITQSGHEVAVWPYKGGIAMMSTDDGPEKQTMQYAPDGINFELRSYIYSASKKIPRAIGLVRSLDTNTAPTAALAWGLHHEYVIAENGSWLEGENFIARFSFSSKVETQEFVNKK